MTQNAINNDFILANAGAPLLDMSFVNANAVIAISGQNDLYTVPAGRRAVIPAVYCNSQGSVNANVQFKNSSTYYNAASTLVSLTAGTPQNIKSLIPIILEAGEVLSVILSGAISVNCWPQIIEFSSTSVLKTAKFLNLVSGNNLVYTCPAGKTAMILDTKLNFGGASATAFSAVGSSLACYFMYVPNGQAAGTGFRFSNNVTPGSSGVTGGAGASSATRGPCLTAGDAIYANCAGSLAMCAILNILENDV